MRDSARARVARIKPHGGSAKSGLGQCPVKWMQAFPVGYYLKERDSKNNLCVNYLFLTCAWSPAFMSAVGRRWSRGARLLTTVC